ncbi:hypothetical protein ACIQVO_40105 [Streptomyces sp. NPDC101062]
MKTSGSLENDEYRSLIRRWVNSRVVVGCRTGGNLTPAFPDIA